MSLGFLNEALQGTVVVERVDSALLRGNALGDPSLRHCPVYLPPHYHCDETRFPLLLVLGGHFSSAPGWLGFRAFEENIIQLADRLMEQGAIPHAILAFPDCSTRYGGSQYLDSSGTGPYQRHLVEEILPLLDRHFRLLDGARHRAVAGRSSGGFGALRVAMSHPGLFAHCASGAGDLNFHMGLRPELARLPSTLERQGGLISFLAHLSELRSLNADAACLLNAIALSTCYSPSQDFPGFLLPVDPHSGEVDEGLFQLWRDQDPAERVLCRPAEVDALGSLETLYVEAGDRDEYHADLGARVFAHRCARQGLAVDLHIHPGGHFGGRARWEEMLPKLLGRMA